MQMSGRRKRVEIHQSRMVVVRTICKCQESVAEEECQVREEEGGYEIGCGKS